MKDENLRTLTHYLLLLGLTSGLGFGEMVGLTRDDFNFMTNEISVYETWVYKEETGFVPTKNEQSIRVVQMDQKTIPVFKILINELRNNETGLVFYSEHSKLNSLTNKNTNKVL